MSIKDTLFLFEENSESTQYLSWEEYTIKLPSALQVSAIVVNEMKYYASQEGQNASACISEVFFPDHLSANYSAETTAC